MSKKIIRKYVAALVVMAVGLVVCGGVVVGMDILRSEYPEVEVEYSTKELTNRDVTVRMKKPTEDTEITNNDGSDTYTFTENGEFTFEFTASEKIWKATVTVDWIDKTAPRGRIEFYCVDGEGVEALCVQGAKTNRPVTAVLVVEDEPNGFRILNNLTPDEEDSEESGEETEGSEGEASEDSEKVTGDSEDTLNGSEGSEGKQPEAAKSGSDRFVFERNGIFTFKVQDGAGNTGEIVARVDWIDTAAPKVEVKYSPEVVTEGCERVVARLEKVVEGETVELAAGPEIADFVPIDTGAKYDAEGLQYDEDYILTDEEGVVMADGVATHVFTEDGKFEFKYRDEAGNTGTAVAEVTGLPAETEPDDPDNPDEPKDPEEDPDDPEDPKEDPDEPKNPEEDPGDDKDPEEDSDDPKEDEPGDFQGQDPSGLVGAGMLEGTGGLGEMNTMPGMLDYVAQVSPEQGNSGQSNPGQTNPGSTGQDGSGQAGSDQSNAGQNNSQTGENASTSVSQTGGNSGASSNAGQTGDAAGSVGAQVAVVDNNATENNTAGTGSVGSGDSNAGDEGAIDGGAASGSSVTEAIGLPAGVKPQNTPLVLDNGLRGKFGSNSEYFELSFVDEDGKVVAERPEEVTFELPVGKNLVGIYIVKDDGTTEPVEYEYGVESGKIVVKNPESGKYLFDYEDKKVETTPAKEEKQEEAAKEEWYDNPILLWGIGGAVVILVIGVGAAVVNRRREYEE